MAWALRGLRNGVVTTPYPRRPDAYADAFHGGVAVLDARPGERDGLSELCPTGAISHTETTVTLDRGACILCGVCVRARPDVFGWQPGSATAARDRPALVVPSGSAATPQDVAALRGALAQRVRRLRRSVHVRHVDAGSDGSEEWEIHALTNPVYDVHRLGIFFTASPRHADILLLTGVGARGMLAPMRRTRAAMPDPVVVIAVGTDAISGGLVAPSYASEAGLLDQIDVDVVVPGSPPPPFAILSAILLALGRLPAPQTVARRA